MSYDKNTIVGYFVTNDKCALDKSIASTNTYASKVEEIAKKDIEKLKEDIKRKKIDSQNRINLSRKEIAED